MGSLTVFNVIQTHRLIVTPSFVFPKSSDVILIADIIIDHTTCQV